MSCSLVMNSPFEVFEAAVAAHTSLSGTPEVGMRNPELLLARVKAENSSPAIRAFALRLLPVRSMAPVKDSSTPKASLPEGLTIETTPGIARAQKLRAFPRSRSSFLASTPAANERASRRRLQKMDPRKPRSGQKLFSDSRPWLTNTYRYSLTLLNIPIRICGEERPCGL